MKEYMRMHENVRVRERTVSNFCTICKIHSVCARIFFPLETEMMVRRMSMRIVYIKNKYFQFV